jgi:hypothetical protein
MQRRTLLKTGLTAAGTAIPLATGVSAASAATTARPMRASAHQGAPLGPALTWTIFSRHLQWLTTQAYAQAAPRATGELIGQAAAQLGFPAVDLTVRPGGHVEPSAASTNLAPMLDGIRSTGVRCDQITTGITTAATQYAAQTLAAAADAGVRYFRWSSLPYPATVTPAFGTRQLAARIKSVQPAVDALANLAARYRMTGLYHTFSGGSVGSALWDLVELFAPYGPEHLAVNYATEHMFGEGAISAWKFNLQNAIPLVRGVALADMTLVRSASGGAGESGATPGTGLVDFASLFTVLHEAAFTGPVEILTEYVYDGVNLNSTFWADSPALTLTRQQLFTTIAASLATYQGYATAAGWTIAQQDTADPA